MNLLVVEDAVELSNSICEYLGQENFICEQAFNYRQAQEKLSLYNYFCIILDINLPDGSGLQLLKELKLENKLDSILIISAKNSLEDKVEGLNAGADDYLTKPFHLPELAARVTAIIRRKSFDGNNIIEFGDLKIDLVARVVSVNGQEPDLTKKEFQLLLYFVSNKNKVISKNAIAVHLWGDEMDMGNHFDFIYTHIKNLRRKLAHAGAADYIESIYGMGYKLSLPS
ncbi:MAG: response regulator transcription factor [Chitinophagaceae bacterium]|nr:MAG: response regulator transcription factor [Chitinophagaceae bacterium]